MIDQLADSVLEIDGIIFSANCGIRLYVHGNKDIRQYEIYIVEPKCPYILLLIVIRLWKT
jgi:hypothetical protein